MYERLLGQLHLMIYPHDFPKTQKRVWMQKPSSSWARCRGESSNHIRLFFSATLRSSANLRVVFFDGRGR